MESNNRRGGSYWLTRAVLKLPIKEIYDINPGNVLEFSYEPAKHRLYYDKSSARDRSILWLEVVNIY